MQNYFDKKTINKNNAITNNGVIQQRSGTPIQLKDNRPKSIAQRKNANVIGSKKIVQKKENEKNYNNALLAITENSLGETGPATLQFTLIEDYAAAETIMTSYQPDAWNSTWGKRFTEALNAGYPAPHLVGHASKKGGVDGKGEKSRTEQNAKILTTWWTGYKVHSAASSSSSSSSSSKPSSSGMHTESKKAEKKAASSAKKKEEFEASEEPPPYVAPWNGGPSAWHK